MATPLRLSPGKLLRTRSVRSAAQILAAMPQGCARLEGTEVVVVRAVAMHFEVLPEPAPASPPPPRPFVFDYPTPRRA